MRENKGDTGWWHPQGLAHWLCKWISLLISISWLVLLQTWKGATQIRRELVAKARISILACFEVGADSGWTDDDLQEALKWLLDDMKFMNSGMDIKVSLQFRPKQSRTNTDYSHIQNLTCGAQASLKNIAFRLLLESQWWGPKGEGRRCSRKGNVYTDNLPILVLISCSVSDYPSCLSV